MTALRSVPHFGVLVVASSKVIAGCVVVVPSLALAPPLFLPRLPVFGLYLVLFSSTAALLVSGARGNKAATLLAAAFLLIAVPWADTPIEQSAASGGIGSSLLFLTLVRVDSFLPYVLWSFAGFFPNSTLLGRTRTVHRWGRAVSLGAGAFLFLANLAMFLGPDAPTPGAAGALEWARKTDIGVYWTVLYLLDLSALGFLAVRSRRVRSTERRRATLFIAALAVGAAPILLLTIGEFFIPQIARLWEAPYGTISLLFVVDIGLLSIPLTTAYSVLVHRVVDVRFVLRVAMQYTLARYTVLAATVAPFLLLVGLLYRSREQTLASILSGPTSLLLLGLTAVGGLALRARRSSLRYLDRRFFRAQYDSARILADLAHRLQTSETPTSLWDSLRHEISRSLHPVTMDLLLRAKEGTGLVSVGSRGPGPPINGLLVSLLIDSQGPFQCEPEQSGETWSQLSEREVDWLTDADVRLLVPIVGRDRRMLGILALGPRESELPYSKEDRNLLEALATAVALVVDSRLSEPSTGGAFQPPDFAEEPTRTLSESLTSTGAPPADLKMGLAVACSRCGQIDQRSSGVCRSCSGAFEVLNLPRTLHGKFRLERLIGRGGMGVVFLAHDLDLDRLVAIKSLPRVSAKYSSLLRQEARAMASVTHPHLALIFGTESYRRLPLLVIEYLSGGTLSRRVAVGPMAVAEVLNIGASMADVIESIHRAGILHRDIKPSNIGFTSEGSPKLLDFGLARLVEAGGLATTDSTTEASGQQRRVAGTLSYLSPEAIRGESPHYSFDLWSLSVTLYQALTGSNPFRGKTSSETLTRIERCDLPAARDSRPDCPPELNKLLRRSLHRDRRRRPSSARELRTMLETLAVQFS